MIWIIQSNLDDHIWLSDHSTKQLYKAANKPSENAAQSNDLGKTTHGCSLFKEGSWVRNKPLPSGPCLGLWSWCSPPVHCVTPFFFNPTPPPPVSSFLLVLCLPICLFPSAFPIKILHKFFLYPLCNICPAKLLLFHFVILIILLYEYLHNEAPHRVIFSVWLSLSVFPSFRSQYSPQHFIFKDSIFVTPSEWECFAPIQNNRQMTTKMFEDKQQLSKQW